jgi:hypothetical protein
MIDHNDGNFIHPSEHALLSGRLLREGIEHSVPLTYEDADTMRHAVGRATLHTDGTITCEFNTSSIGLKLQDMFMEGSLKDLSISLPNKE